MGRYDRNRNKKSNTTIFIVAILSSLLIGISGTYYVMENSRKVGEEEAGSLIAATAREDAVSGQFPQLPMTSVEDVPDLVLTEPEAAVSDSGQIFVEQSGLPDLLTSDGFVRRALIKMAPGLDQWLNTDQLIRKYVLILNNFAQGLRITKHVSFFRLEEPFAVGQSENGLAIAPKSFARYNSLAQTIQAIDARAAVAFYQKFRPLMLQVFAEFSYPNDITLESIVKKAAGEIIAAPAINGPIAVVRPSAFYKFADPALEALNPVQKQMIRMGSTNMRIIQSKCREFLVALGKSGLR